MLAAGRWRMAASRLLSNGSKPPFKPRPKLALNVSHQEEQFQKDVAPASSNPLEDEFFRIEKKFPRRVPDWDQVELKTHPTSDAEELRKAFDMIRNTLEECGHFHDKQKHVMLQLTSKLLAQDFTKARTSWD